MTKVSVEEFYDSRIVSIEGHAGFGACGGDIVCAAISALAYTLINSLKWAQSDDWLFMRTESVSDGSVYLEFEPYDFAKDRVQAIIDTCMTGFTLIEEEYPDYIEVGA